MLSVQSSGSENNTAKFSQEFEDYRKACRERYLQQTPIQSQAIAEEVAPNEDVLSTTTTTTTTSPKAVEEVAESVVDSPAVTNTSTLTPLMASLNLSSSAELPALDTLRKSGKTEERRNSFTKFISGIFAKKPSSPQISSKPEKKKPTKEEQDKAEQDWRMARFIAELEYEGKSDQEIQMHLFQVRDQSQFGPPRQNRGFFKEMSQAFKDEFSQRRNSTQEAEINPFYAAPPSDVPYTYEQLLALENVPRGVKSLEHLPTLTYNGQDLPSAQTTCAVCMMEFEKDEELRGLHCTHHFHMECIDKWLSVGTTCPVCKSEVEADHTLC